MSYLVLARKFRPQTFELIVGQEHITRALANSIIWQRVPHALLFTGPRGVGKTTSARVFARALNCTGRGGEAGPAADLDNLAPEEVLRLVEPCGNCQNCKEIARSSSIAVWEIDGASNNSVENVRDLIDSLRSLPPPGSRYKIYIIDEVHMLSTAAFNALLKSLEEPPPNTIFIFATTEPHKIPDTVISRCQRHDFRRVPVGIITNTLKSLAEAEEVDGSEEVFEYIALKAKGGMRDAQTMLDRLISFCGKTLDLNKAQQVFGTVDASTYFDLSASILNQDAQNCFLVLDRVFEQSVDVRAFIADFVLHFRNLFLLSTAKSQTRQEDPQIAKILEVTKRDLLELGKQVEGHSSFDFHRLFEIAESSAQTALSSNFPRFVLEAAVAKMCMIPSLLPLAEIVQGFPNLPKKIGPQKEQVEVVSHPRRELIKKEDAASLESGPELANSEPLSFNPSWQEFINYVKVSRSNQVLAAFLRRVSPQTFTSGRLILEASEFDINALKDPEMLNTLKSSLAGYSAQEIWDVGFVPAALPAKMASSKKGGDIRAKAEIKKSSEALPGSIVALEAEAERNHKIKIDVEARNDPLVKAALSTFEGSTIEKVSILKEGGK